MSYQINKTDGTLLVDLADGQRDVNTTDLALIGRNYRGFGENFNENFIKLLENFANQSAPANPLRGQLWYDTTEERLKVYNGNEFTSSGVIVSAQQPQMVSGDLWLNNEANQLYMFDGTDLVLVGPNYSAFQGVSGVVTDTVLDIQGTSRTVIKFYVGNALTGVYSNIEFTPGIGQAIPGLTGAVGKGFTTIDQDFKWNGTATRADSLIDAQGTVRLAAQFLASDSDDTTTGALTIQNDQGLTIGLNQNNISKIVGTSFVTENQLTDQDYKIRVRTTSGPIDAVTIDTSLRHLGIFEPSPQAQLDVGGDVRIQGNLTVEGDTTSFEVTQLRVENKNIEMGVLDDSTLATDAQVDGGGIILQSQQGSKDFVWKQATDSWTTNVNIDITNKAIKANGVTVLQGTDAPGLTSIGALQSLDVDNMNFDGVRITTTGNGLQISSAGDIAVVNNQKIVGVADPTNAQDVATKAYVDRAINLETISMALDVTGLSNAQIAQVLEDIAPAATKENGTEARIHCTDTASASATFTAAQLVAALQKSNVTVQALDGLGNDDGSASVLGDITFTDVTGAVTLTVDRSLRLFRVVSGQWAYIQDLTSSV
jgi:hypothetical protein